MDSARKKAVREFAELSGTGDIAGLRRLVTNDFMHEIVGTTKVAGKRNLDEILAQAAAFSKQLIKSKFIFTHMGEEGDQVFAMFSGECELANGKRYDGRYANVTTFRGDKMTALYELVDTKLVDSILEFD